MMRGSDLKHRMRNYYEDVTDNGSQYLVVRIDRWWADYEILSNLGKILADPFATNPPTAVVGPAASGYLLGPLVATHFGTGFIAVSKDPGSGVDSDQWHARRTPPDHRDRNLVLGLRKGLLKPSDRVLAVDDLVETGGQLSAIKDIVELDCGSTWLGASVLIDALQNNSLRRKIGISSLFHSRDL